MAVLEIENLSVEFPSAKGFGRAADRVSLTVAEGEVLGIVGESGAGKSLAMLAVMGLVPFPGRVTADRLAFQGRDLIRIAPRARRALAGKGMAMIFQDPMASLNPSFSVGFQLTESLRVHERMDRAAARRRAIELLEQVGIPAAESRLRAYPHQLSGGMNQRVMIAIAIACRPSLLIADEPTTALDVTVQAQILELLRSLQRQHGMALVLVTHNMDVLADTAHRVAVMYAGQVVETRDTESLFGAPQHPYTAALLAARPQCQDRARLATIPGTMPGLYDRPPGCLFGPRCAYATTRSRTSQPEIRPWMGGEVRCHYPLGDPSRDARIAADGRVAQP
jgi:dipeptide transport system ATP-binding protein